MVIEWIRFEVSWHRPRAEQDTQPFHKFELIMAPAIEHALANIPVLDGRIRILLIIPPQHKSAERARPLRGVGRQVDGNLFRLGRRLFYHRAQQILDIMHPGREIQAGFNLICLYCESEIPGAAVSNALCDGENINGHCLSVIEAREAH
jgi:hypothetical protein